MEKREKKKKQESILVLGILFSIILLGFVIAADPVSPDGISYGENETKNASDSLMVNISGGVISNFNLSATIQNPRWKAFVGQVVGSFTLSDSSGSTIYDWTLATVTGRVYATRTNGAVAWTSIGCADIAALETENTQLSHSNPDDNLTATFSDQTHDTFYVGANVIPVDSCPTLNTYVNSVKNEGSGQPFEEMVLHDGSNLVFASILEEDQTGYNGESYDFQMIVPENGSAGFTSATPYYLYVEIGN
jgi:hypothetical protein